MRYLYCICRFFLLITYKVFFRYEVSGHENVPGEGGALITANHLSYLDPPLVGIALKRRATFMAQSGLFKIPLIGIFVNSFSFPVDREQPKPSTIKEAVQRLKNGELIIMFPEGTRSPGGESSSGKRGAVAIASMGKAPIIPALIEGTERALPRGARFVRPVKLKVTFGRPITKKEGESDREFQQRITQDLLNIINNLSNS